MTPFGPVHDLEGAAHSHRLDEAADGLWCATRVHERSLVRVVEVTQRGSEPLAAGFRSLSASMFLSGSEEEDLVVGPESVVKGKSGLVGASVQECVTSDRSLSAVAVESGYPFTAQQTPSDPSARLNSSPNILALRTVTQTVRVLCGFCFDRWDIIDLSRATSSATPGVHLAAQRALERLPARLGTDGYELSELPELRRALAERFTTRGLPTTPDQIAVTSGSQSAISLLARVFVARGDVVIVENPGYPHANEAWRVAGGRLKSISVDPVDGWDLDGFEQLVARTQPTLAFLMPDFQNPTARSMTENDRQRVAHLADSLGFVVVADETTTELDIDRGDTRLPLAAHARLPDSVVTVGSVSKTVWGGLRIGWVRASVEIIDRIVAARFSNDLGAAVIDQLVVSELLDDFDEVLAMRCEALRQSRDTLVAAVERHLPAARVPHVEGGVAAWVHLGSPVSSALTSAAREKGLLLGAGPWFGLDGEFERHTRIPITARPESIERAVQIMADVWPIPSLGGAPLLMKCMTSASLSSAINTRVFDPITLHDPVGFVCCRRYPGVLVPRVPPSRRRYSEFR